MSNLAWRIYSCTRASYVQTKQFTTLNLKGASRLLSSPQSRERHRLQLASQPHSAAMAETPPVKPSRRPSSRLILLGFYRKHNPTREGRVDVILEKFQGKEDKLWASLEGKYGEDPRELYAATLRPTVETVTPVALTPKRRGLLHALGLARRSDLEEERKLAESNRGRARGIEKLRSMEKREMADLVLALQKMLKDQVHATHDACSALRERAALAEALAADYEGAASNAEAAAQSRHRSLEVDASQVREELGLSHAHRADLVQRVESASTALESTRAGAEAREALLQARIQTLETRVAASVDAVAQLSDAASETDRRAAVGHAQLIAAQGRADELAAVLAQRSDALRAEAAACAQSSSKVQRLELKMTAVVEAATAGQRALSEAQAEASALAVAAEHDALAQQRLSELSKRSSAHLESEYEAAIGESARQAQSLRELREVIASTEDGRETVQEQMQVRCFCFHLFCFSCFIFFHSSFAL